MVLTIMDMNAINDRQFLVLTITQDPYNFQSFHSLKGW